MEPRTISPSRSSGFSLVELAVYVALVAILAAPLLSVVLVSTRSVAEADSLTTVQERNRSMLMELRRELRRAILTTVDVDVNGTLRFNLPAAFTGAGAGVGDRIAYSFIADPNKTPYGNVVPGRLARTNETTLENHLVTADLDLLASSFVFDGQSVQATLSHAKKDQESDSPLFRITRSITVEPRN